MAVNKYITLRNSNSSLSRRFKATQMRLPRLRSDTIEYTIGGKTDKQAGPVFRQFFYVLRIPVDDPIDANYGKYSELLTLFDLSNSNATPSDVITLVDHWGNSYSVYFASDLDPEPLTHELEGDNAWFMVAVLFTEKT
jgi:hypothetical protein